MSKRRKITAAIASLLGLLLVLGVGYGGYLYKKTNDSLSDIKRDNYIDENDVKPGDPLDGKAFNILILGSDSRNPADKGRSDSMMVAHVTADRQNVYLVSIPRDVYTTIPGHQKQKINAAYQYGGVPLAVKTVNELFEIKLQHAVLVDFESFMNLIDTLDGVTIDNPYEGVDTEQHVTWHKGVINLNKVQALQYSRWRHGLPNGDISRAGNQQRVFKAIVSKLLSAGTLSNPQKLSSLIESVSKNLTVDKGLTNDVIKALALNMRVKSSENVKTITTPLSGYEAIDPWGDVDLLDKVKMKELKTAFAKDTLEQYYIKYKNAPVVGDSTVPEPKGAKS